MGNESFKNKDLEGVAEINLRVLSDSQLYQKCKEYGGNARLWMRKFEGLLPEVCRRRLHRHRGFTSIHEFAAKLAGMSYPKVDRILQLSRKLEDKPKLREAFESGEVGYSKIAKVAYIAKSETDGFWAEKVQTESCTTIDLSVKEEKSEKSVYIDSFQSEFQRGKLTFNVDPEIERKFRALKQKLEKQSGETMSYGEVLGELMKMVEKVAVSAQASLAQESSAQASSAQKVQAEKQVTIKVCPDCAEKKAKEAKGKTAPTIVKRLVLARQNNQCARAHCTHPPSDLHHINGYALTGSHSPEGLEYLCEKHHKLAHAQHEFVQVYRRE